MKKTSKTIVFFGSGPVAAESLRLLAQAFEIEAVITKPQPPHHRQPFPVLAVAESLGLDIFTASSTAEVSKLFAKQPFKSELGIIIDHGIILTSDVISYFPFGIVNSHFSLLPRWRGADPISFALLNGDAETGVSLMLIAKKLDEGLLIAQEKVSIPPDATTPSLTKQLITASQALMEKTLPSYLERRIKPYPQPDIQPTYSRKLKKADGVIDWSQPAAQIERQVRAYAGWPRSRTKLGGKDVVVTKVSLLDRTGSPGTVSTENNQLVIFAHEGALILESLIPAGKKEMSGKAFLAGYSSLL